MYLIIRMILKHTNSDSENSDLLKRRSHKMCLLKEKVKLFDLIRKESELYAEVTEAE